MSEEEKDLSEFYFQYCFGISSLFEIKTVQHQQKQQSLESELIKKIQTKRKTMWG